MTDILFLDTANLKIKKCICHYSYWCSLADWVFKNLIHIFKCLNVLSISCVIKNIASSLSIGFPVAVTCHTGTLHLFSSVFWRSKQFHHILIAQTATPCLDLPLLSLFYKPEFKTKHIWIIWNMYQVRKRVQFRWNSSSFYMYPSYRVGNLDFNKVGNWEVWAR